MSDDEAMNSRGLSRPLDSQSPLTGCLLLFTYLCVLAAVGGTTWSCQAELTKSFGSGPGLTFGVVFTFFGLLFLVLAAKDTGWWWASRRWAVAEARIVASRVLANDGGEGGPNIPEIIYEFEVMGKQIKSDYVRFGGYGHGDAEFLVDYCIAGRPVRVYYDPSNPQRCCLQRFVGGWWTMHLTGLFFAVLGIVFLILATPRL